MYLITFKLVYLLDSLVINHPSPTNNLYSFSFFLFSHTHIYIYLYLWWKQRNKKESNESTDLYNTEQYGETYHSTTHQNDTESAKDNYHR